MAVPSFTLENSYARDLEGFSVPWRPEAAPAPRSLFFNEPLAQQLGLDVAGLSGDAGAALFAGNTLPEGAEPIAQAYAGHQFGGFSPQLGDGRAVLLGEVIDRRGQRRDIAFKGSGRTPFSRGGDGKAAVGPNAAPKVLIGEAMHALGIPTTRALAVVATGQPVMRVPSVLPGAVLTRVAASHIRVGTFQLFAARGDVERVRQLAEYTIAAPHDPRPGRANARRFFGLLERVAERQAGLIAQWMNVGFIHGVMNTDNMTISGETIDYGPCAFVEAYDPAAVFSSIDTQGRYAFGNQPGIARWNLARFAETLLPLLSADEAEATAQATRVIEAFPATYVRHLLAGQREARPSGYRRRRRGRRCAMLAGDWLALLQVGRVDFTLGWRRRPCRGRRRGAAARAVRRSDRARCLVQRWRERCAREDEGASETAGAASLPARMRRVNPWVIPRNHRVEEALSAASADDDLGPFERLLAALREPYDESAHRARYAEPATAEVTASYRTFCGT